MAETLLIDFLSPEQLAQLTAAGKGVDEVRAKVRAFNQEAKGLEINIGNANNVKELNAALSQAPQLLAKLTAAVNDAKRALADLQQAQQRQAEAATVAISKQTAAQERLNQVVKNSAQSTYSGGTPADQPNPANTGTVINAEETAALQAQQTAQAELGAATTATTTASQLEAAAFLESLTAGQELIQTQNLLTTAIKEVGAETKANDAALKSGAVSQEEYEATTIQLTDKLLLLKAELRNVNLELNGEARAAVVDETSITGLSAQLDVLRGQYKLLSAEQRNSPLGVEMAANIQRLDGEVKALDASVGQSQRNVGNYNSGLVTTEGIIKRLGSQITRFIAVMVIFQAAIELFKEAGNAISDSLDRANLAQVTAQEVAKKSVNTFSDEATQITLLRDRFEDAKSSLSDKEDVVETLNQKFGNQIGKLNGVNDAEKFFRDKSDDFIKALQFRAQGMGALAALTELYQKQALAAADPSSTVGAFKTFATGGGALFQAISDGLHGNAVTFEETGQRMKNAVRAAGQANVQDTQNQLAEQTKIIEGLYKTAEDGATALDKKNGFDTNQTGKKAPKTRIKKTPDDTNAELAAQKFNLDQTALLEEEAAKKDQDLQQSIYENHNKSLKQRLDASEKYYDDEVKLIQIARGTQEQEVLTNLNKIAEIEEKSANKRSKPEKDLLLKKSGFLKEYQRLVLEQQRDEEKAVQDADARKEGFYKDDFEKRIQGLKDVTAAAQQAGRDELTNLRNKGLSAKQYLSEEEAINRTTQINITAAQEKYLQEQVNALNISKEEKEKLQNELNKFLEDNYKADAAAYDDAQKQKAQADKNLLAAEYEGAKQIFALAQKVLDERYQKQIDAENELITAINARKDADLAAIDATDASDADKARLKIEREAEAAAQTERANQKIIDIKKRQAAADKVIAIAQILSTTASTEASLAAVQAKAIADAAYYAAQLFINPVAIPTALALTAAAATIGVQEGVVAALAGLQIASLVIPGLFTGTGPAGVSRNTLAWTDERGPEAYIYPDGRTEIGDERGPKLRYLPQGTRVIPNDKLRAAMQPRVHDLSGRKEQYDSMIAAKAISATITAANHDLIRETRRNRPIAPKNSVFDNYRDYKFGKR